MYGLVWLVIGLGLVRENSLSLSGSLMLILLVLQLPSPLHPLAYVVSIIMSALESYVGSSVCE